MPDYSITHPAVEQYVSGLIPERPPVLRAVEAHAREHGVPIVGPLEGQFLYLLAATSGARRVLEVGTATGYSGLWLVQAVAPRGGHLTTLEADPQRIRLARDHFARAGVAAHVTIVEGDALKTLPTLTGLFDFIFLDILRATDREDVALRLLELSIPRLAAGGLLVADNTLVEGRVALDGADSPPIRGIQQYNAAAARHPELESITVPLRDGVTISRKK